MDKDGENAVFDTRNKRATGLRYAPNRDKAGAIHFAKAGALGKPIRRSCGKFRD
jgi:hypothetical protein